MFGHKGGVKYELCCQVMNGAFKQVGATTRYYADVAVPGEFWEARKVEKGCNVWRGTRSAGSIVVCYGRNVNVANEKDSPAERDVVRYLNGYSMGT